MFWRMVNQVSREKRRFLTVLFSITVVLSTFEIEFKIYFVMFIIFVTKKALMPYFYLY